MQIQITQIGNFNSRKNIMKKFLIWETALKKEHTENDKGMSDIANCRPPERNKMLFHDFK